MDLAVIGRQVQTNFGGRIDLLALDVDANCVILELKRDKTPREAVAQILDYAAWIRGIGYNELDQIAESYVLGDKTESRGPTGGVVHGPGAPLLSLYKKARLIRHGMSQQFVIPVVELQISVKHWPLVAFVNSIEKRRNLITFVPQFLRTSELN